MASGASGKTIATIDAAFDLYEAGDPTGAAAVCATLLDADADNYGALYLLGSIRGEQGALAEAIAHLQRAVALKPEKPLAHFNLAHILNQAKNAPDALPAIDAYLALVPNNPEAHVLRALICARLKRFDEAARSAAGAAQLRPGYAEAYNALASALGNLGRVDEALAGYAKAVALTPGYAEAYRNRGNLLSTLGRYSDALADYQRAFRLKPEIDYLPGDILFLKERICDWDALDELFAKVSDGIREGKPASSPFALLSLPTPLTLQSQAAANFARNESLAQPKAAQAFSHPRHEKIRIAYFSADFREHPVATLSAELYERHDRQKFEVFAFSFGPDTSDPMRQRLRRGFDAFIDVQALSEREIAELAREKEIDIAIDLGGYTENARPGIFASRAAPVQVAFLGYPGTMGADFIDYIIADRIVIPEGRRAAYAEKVAYLPHSFLPNDSQRPIAERRFSRADCALPERSFVFCCFNNGYKISRDVFDGWMRILKRTPGSVLWLRGENEAAVRNLCEAARLRDVDPSRLIFAERVPSPADHLGRHRVAGLFLDTLPYNAHTTAADALWAGLPVLTQIGETFAGRVAASLLTAIGLPELITQSRAEYEALAVELATDPERLAAITKKLAAARLTTPLFDAEGYARGLESAYAAMYERQRANMPPDVLYVEP
jgi:predicted O-linked N-acetylglucosamine transferase (SPINDLY family)